MSSAPRHTTDEQLAKRQRFKIIKAAIAVLFVLLLLYSGFQGRQHARSQARLNEILLVRDQLQQKLDDEQKPSEYLGGVPGTNTNASQPPLSNPAVAALVNDLNTRIGQFDSERRSKKLSEVENLGIRLSKATLANAERRFDDALALLRVEGQKGNRPSTSSQSSSFLLTLKTRGDSFYGLRKWQDALDCYQRMLPLTRNQTGTMGRIADCHYVLGQTNEALAAYIELAKNRSNRGGELLIQGKTDAAIGHYDKAAEVLTLLIDRQGRGELETELATIHNSRGNALLTQGKVDAARREFEKSVEILTRLVERQGRRELANELAMSHSNLGNALFGQQKFDDVIVHYGKAIEIQSRLSDQKGQSELAIDLAITRNNRGVALRAQGKLDAAIADFDIAIKTLTALDEQQGRNESAVTQTNREPFRVARKLNVLLGFSEKEVDVQTLPRLANEEGREQTFTLIILFKNRGYAYLVQKNLNSATADFKKAMQVYATLVAQEGEANPTLQSGMNELRSRLALQNDGRK